jgi:putative hydrolase of the HAD superfamily
VRAVIFDAGNTLLRMDYRIIAEHLLTRGRDVTSDQVEEAELRARVRLDPHLAPGNSTESTAIHGRYLRYLLEHLAITDDTEIEAIARWRRGYNVPVGLWNRADPEALAAVRRVRAAGLVAGVISNSNGSVRSILEEAGLAAHLDFIIDSSVVGVEKPDPRIFHLGLREAGVAAHEAVYVGDLYSVDVLGARAAGLDGILLDPRGYWGPRDCRLARGLEDAVRLALTPAGGSRRDSGGGSGRRSLSSGPPRPRCGPRSAG